MSYEDQKINNEETEKINDKEYKMSQSFNKWLKNSTLRGYLMSSHESLCFIKENLVYAGYGSPLYISNQGSSDLYLSVVNVRSMPVGKDLPKELSDVLEQFGYFALPKNKSYNKSDHMRIEEIIS